MKSLSEIETTSKRASRAVGFTWGEAEEVGKSIRLLELFGFPGIKNLNQYYQSKKKENCQAYISKIDNVIEPMFSFWSIKSLAYLETILQENDGYKIMNFAQEIGFEYLDFKRKSKADFFNVNRPEDYKNLLNLI